MLQIQTLDDIEQLLKWMGEVTQKPNLRFYRFVFHRLLDGGEFGAVHVDTLIKLISKNQLWNELLNDETSRTPEILRDRFARRMRWLNKTVLVRDDSPYADTLAIIYDRSSSRYQMVTDFEQVQTIRANTQPRCQSEIVVEIQADDLRQGLPCLRVGGELEFSVRSPITGYIHIFHRDGEGHIDKLFPEHKSELSLRVTLGKELFFPDAISDLCKLKCWTIGAVNMEDLVRQQVLVFVTGRNVDMSESDVAEELGELRARPIIIQRIGLGDLSERQKLSTIVEYQLGV